MIPTTCPEKEKKFCQGQGTSEICKNLIVCVFNNREYLTLSHENVAKYNGDPATDNERGFTKWEKVRIMQKTDSKGKKYISLDPFDFTFAKIFDVAVPYGFVYNCDLKDEWIQGTFDLRQTGISFQVWIKNKI